MFKLFKKNKNARRGGFTLIEMMVSVGLFAVVMLISTAVIFSIINGNRKSQSINTVANNLNFSVESVIRDIKTGYRYNCNDYHARLEADHSGVGDGIFNDLATFKTNYESQPLPPLANNYSCPGNTPISHIAFVSTLSASGQPRVVEYYLEPSSSSPTYKPGIIRKVYYDTASNSVVDSPLTTPDIDVNQFDLYIQNPPPTTDKTKASQPSVFVIINGNARTGNKDTDVSAFGVQTLISQRFLNI